MSHRNHHPQPMDYRTNEPEDYRNFLRMDAVTFDELLDLVTPLIQKKTIVIREPVSPMKFPIHHIALSGDGKYF